MNNPNLQYVDLSGNFASKIKLLALGEASITKWVSEIMRMQGMEVTCLNKMPDRLNTSNPTKYSLAVVDNGLKDIENICFRLIWLYRIRVILITKENRANLSNLLALGVDTIITDRLSDSELSIKIEQAVRQGPLTFPKIKVLLVENDNNIRDSIKLIFESLWPEAEIYEADKSFDGLKITDNSIDVILLDTGLPDIEGFDLLKWLAWV